MSSRRLTIIVAGLVILSAFIARIVMIGSGGVSDSVVDTTGTSANARARATATSRTPQATAAAQPLLVLSSNTVRQGTSVDIFGSGFPGSATVNIYLKQQASDNVNPVAVVEADQNGQFGGVSVTIPDSVP